MPSESLATSSKSWTIIKQSLVSTIIAVVAFLWNQAVELKDKVNELTIKQDQQESLIEDINDLNKTVAQLKAYIEVLLKKRHEIE